MIRTEERKRHGLAPTHWKWGTDQGSGSTTALAIRRSPSEGGDQPSSDGGDTPAG